MAAAVYGASEGLATLLVEREAPGGQAGTTSRIENYLGFPSGLSGADLARRALTQARRLGAELLASQEVRTIRRNDPYRTVVLEDGAEVSCQAVVISTGVAYRQLQLDGADRLAGAGLYYGAATTDAILHRGAQVAVVGGGNSAGQAAVHLSRYAERVHLIIRGGALSGMSQYLIDQIAAIPTIEVRTNASVSAIHGSERLEGITLETTNGPMELPLGACFIFIGQQPHTDWLEGVVARDPGGFLLTGDELETDGRLPAGWGLRRRPFFLETSLPGAFAAGDVRHRSVKRIASAVGEGAMAVQLVHQYLLSV
jgi:thioredoxin reductase (NADPH)